MGEVTDQVTTATIATIPKNTTPATFGSISGFALPSVIHNNLSYRFPVFETSATALCGAAMLCRPLQASESFDFKSVCVRVAQLVALVATVATAAASS